MYRYIAFIGPLGWNRALCTCVKPLSENAAQSYILPTSRQRGRYAICGQCGSSLRIHKTYSWAILSTKVYYMKSSDTDLGNPHLVWGTFFHTTRVNCSVNRALPCCASDIHKASYNDQRELWYDDCNGLPALFDFKGMIILKVGIGNKHRNAISQQQVYIYQTKLFTFFYFYHNIKQSASCRDSSRSSCLIKVYSVSM